MQYQINLRYGALSWEVTAALPRSGHFWQGQKRVQIIARDPKAKAFLQESQCVFAIPLDLLLFGKKV